MQFTITTVTLLNGLSLTPNVSSSSSPPFPLGRSIDIGARTLRNKSRSFLLLTPTTSATSLSAGTWPRASVSMLRALRTRDTSSVAWFCTTSTRHSSNENYNDNLHCIDGRSHGKAWSKQTHWNAHYTKLLGAGAVDCLSDPPMCVGRELEPLAVVKLVDGLVQTNATSLPEAKRCISNDQGSR